MKIVAILNDFLWSWGIAIPLLAVGLFFTILLRVPWARMIRQMFRAIKSEKVGDGASAWDTLCAVVGGQVGTGNVAGVATAIAAGGPGALFWMWVTAVLGMTTMAAETVLGQLYKEPNKDGTFQGGLAYYLANGLKCKWLAAISAVALAIGVGFITPAVHMISATEAIRAVLPCPPWIIGAILTGMLVAIHLGGFKRIASFSSKIVPFMCVFYIGAAVLILITNFPKIPQMFAMIFSCAFNPSAVLGGAVGYTVQLAFRYGMARGLFSNEAGEGTVCHVTASASCRHPVTQGLLGSMGVAIDTLLVCSATGVVILISGVDYTKLDGSILVQAAFSAELGGWASWFIAFELLLFCFTTLITATYIGHVNWRFNIKSKPAFWVFFTCQMIFVMFSNYLPLTTAFSLLDLALAIFTCFNLIALLGLHKEIKSCFSDYETQLQSGNLDPTFDWNTFRTSKGLDTFSAKKLK